MLVFCIYATVLFYQGIINTLNDLFSRHKLGWIKKESHMRQYYIILGIYHRILENNRTIYPIDESSGFHLYGKYLENPTNYELKEKPKPPPKPKSPDRNAKLMEMIKKINEKKKAMGKGIKLKSDNFSSHEHHKVASYADEIKIPKPLIQFEKPVLRRSEESWKEKAHPNLIATDSMMQKLMKHE